jgi:hypothetical protein
MGVIRKTDMRFKRRKSKPPPNFFPSRTEFRYREHAEYDREAALAYSRMIREASAQEPPKPIKTYDEENWARFLERYGHQRTTRGALAVAPARTVNEQIVALLLDD